MGYFDPVIAAILAFIVICLGGYLLYAKRQIRELDRIIADKEAALNAPEQPAVMPH